MKKVYLDELSKKSSELIDYSKNNIANKIEQIRLLSESIIWKGPGSIEYLNNFNSKINQLVKLNNNVRKIAEYLLDVADNYNLANNRINSMYEELLKESNKRG